MLIVNQVVHRLRMVFLMGMSFSNPSSDTHRVNQRMANLRMNLKVVLFKGKDK